MPLVAESLNRRAGVARQSHFRARLQLSPTSRTGSPRGSLKEHAMSIEQDAEQPTVDQDDIDTAAVAQTEDGTDIADEFDDVSEDDSGEEDDGKDDEGED